MPIRAGRKNAMHARKPRVMSSRQRSTEGGPALSVGEALPKTLQMIEEINKTSASMYLPEVCVYQTTSFAELDDVLLDLINELMDYRKGNIIDNFEVFW